MFVVHVMFVKESIFERVSDEWRCSISEIKVCCKSLVTTPFPHVMAVSVVISDGVPLTYTGCSCLLAYVMLFIYVVHDTLPSYS